MFYKQSGKSVQSGTGNKFLVKLINKFQHLNLEVHSYPVYMSNFREPKVRVPGSSFCNIINLFDVIITVLIMTLKKRL